MKHQLYRACLITYPRDFRATYGDELTSVIRSRCRQERDRFGLWRSVTYASGAYLDLVATGLRIRLRSWRSGAGAPARSSRPERGLGLGSGATGQGPAPSPGVSGGGVAGVLDRAMQDLRHAYNKLRYRTGCL